MSRWRPGAAALAAVLAAGLAGCGAAGDGARGTATGRTLSRTEMRPAAVYGGPAPLLVYFKRVVGVDPLASQLVVDTDGSAVATITFGGVGGQKRQVFAIAGARLRTLRALLAGTRLSDTACCNDPGYYLYWISHGGHTWRLEQRRVPAAQRQLIHTLNAITDAHTRF